MKSIKELLASFKKQEPAKIQPKERKDHSLERFVDTHKNECTNGHSIANADWLITEESLPTNYG